MKSSMADAEAVRLEVEIGGLRLPNPILLASGTCGYGTDIAELVDLTAIGGIVTKTVTPKPRAGNPPPRISEVTAGMLNSIGLENVGIDAFVADKLPRARELGTRVVVSIGGETADDYEMIVARLDGELGVDAIELNLSCPNVSGGLDFSREPSACGLLIAAVRARTALPLIAKLTPNVAAMAPVARAAEDAGVDGLSMVNTYVGMAIDVERRRARLSTVVGGLSGPAIRPLALARVWEVSQAVSIPVIGIGGVVSAGDVLEFLLAGAAAVQVGTHNFVDPRASGAMAAEIHAYLERHGFASPAALRHRFERP